MAVYTRKAQRTSTTTAATPTTPAPQPAFPTYADEPTFLKSLRDFEVDRKVTRKATLWEVKKAQKSRTQVLFCTRNPSAGKAPSRLNMTMRVKGGWDVQLEDAGVADALAGETDWIAEVEHRPAVREVSLEDLLRPGKPRKARKDGDFELVPGMPSVIALDDAPSPEPEVEEPWEELDFDELDDRDGTRPSSRILSYAEIAATAT